MKRKILLVLSIVLVVLGLILCLATLTGLLFMALGVVGIIYSIKTHDQPVRRSAVSPSPAAPSPRPTPAPAAQPAAPVAPEGIPSAKPRKRVTCKIAGVTFKCSLDRDEMRQDVLDGMAEGDPIEIKPYAYRGDPAFLLVDPATGLDFGNVPADVAEALAAFPDPVYEGYLAESGSFENENGDWISYGKVRIFVI